MKKIGRNDPCPCGSGLKYKKCCALKEETFPVEEAVSDEQMFVTSEIGRLQRHAAKKKKGFKLIGTFIFFATSAGDAWLLELTGLDAVKVAADGRPIDVVVEETEETLEVNWTHSFAVEGHRLVTTAYLDGTETSHGNTPTTLIKDALAKLKRKFSEEDLDAIRLGDAPEP